MALQEFLTSVRIGASVLPPEVWEDPAHAPAEVATRAFQLADIWLTPAVVRGYADGDFAALPAAERERLREAVAAFRAVAAGVTPATPEQVSRALPHFLTILDVVRPYIANREALDARRAVWQACEPYRDWAPAFDSRLGFDWTGDPGVWVWLILNNDVDVTTRDTQLRIADVREAIDAQLVRAGIDRILYESVWKREEVVPVVLRGAGA